MASILLLLLHKRDITKNTIASHVSLLLRDTMAQTKTSNKDMITFVSSIDLSIILK